MPKPIRHLLVLSGPLAIGKSYTETQIRSGQLTHLEPVSQLGQTTEWITLTPATYLQRAPEDKLPEQVLLHYELTRLITRAGFALTDFAKDPALEIVDQAERVSVITLWTPGKSVARRLKQRRSQGTRLREWLKPNQRHAAALALFHQQERLNDLYAAWFSYWEGATQADQFIWNVSDGLPKLLSRQELDHLLKSGKAAN